MTLKLFSSIAHRITSGSVVKELQMPTTAGTVKSLGQLELEVESALFCYEVELSRFSFMSSTSSRCRVEWGQTSQPK